jgi:hypothetical protein
MTHQMANGLTLGASEAFESAIIHSHTHGPPVSKLAIELEWSTPAFKNRSERGAAMRAPIVRGSPYTSMFYFSATPSIRAQRILKSPIVIDQGKSTSKCDSPDEKIHVEQEMKMAFDTSDITWLVFVSEPMDFYCRQFDADAVIREMNLKPGVVPKIFSSFNLTAADKMYKGMIRVAMSNNCTSGQNPECKLFSFLLSF